MFYEVYEKLCAEHGETPFGLPPKLGIGKNSIVANWQKGAIPRAKTLQTLADYFGVSIAYLLGEEQEPQAQQKKPVPNWDELSDSHKKLIEAVYSMDEASVTRLQLIVDMVLAEREK